MDPARAAYLLELARDPSPEARGRLVDEAAIAYTSISARPSDTEIALFADIMQSLLADAELDVRRRLSTAVKHAPWAPRTLISSLAMDVAVVAAPVISASPVMDDSMLIAVVQQKGTAHRSLVASRRDISEAISTAIVETRDLDPIRVLGTNRSARITLSSMQRALEFGQNTDDILEAFGLRSDLPIDLIVMAYSFAGAAVRASIAGRDDVDPALLDAAVASASIEAARERAAGELDARSAAAIAQAARGDRARGPTPGVLLQSLMNGRKDLFLEGMAELTGLSTTRLMDAICYGSNKTFIIAARAAGFDLASVSGVHARLFTDDGKRAWTPTDDMLVHEIFDAITQFQAISALAKSPTPRANST